MSAEAHWDATTAGIVQGCFFIGYMMTQIPAGRLADRIGGRRCLAAAVASWSLFTALTPIAARNSLPALYLIRALLGLAEGFAMPAVNAAVATWVPQQETARALSFIYSGMYGGSILGLLVSPLVLRSFSWPMLFYSFGAAGFIWSILFWFTTSDTPGKDPYIEKAEREYILANAPASRGSYMRIPTNNSETKASAPVNTSAATTEHDESTAMNSDVDNVPSLGEIFSKRPMWAICIAHFCCTWGYFVLLTWLPTFLHMRFKLDVSHSSLYATAPWVSMFIAANISGFTADALLANGIDKTKVRKLMQAIAFIGPSIFLAILANAESATTAMIYVAAALALASLSNSGVYSNHQDIGPKIAGTLLGISNTFASIPGIVGVSITGVILDHTNDNWAAVFHLAIAFYIIGFVAFSTFATAETIWE